MLYTRSELEARLKMLLGGLAAEEVLMGERSTGAQDDLRRATLVAREMVSRYGMGQSVGLMAVPDSRVARRAEPLARVGRRHRAGGAGAAGPAVSGGPGPDRDESRPVCALVVELSDRETLDGEEVRRILGA